MGKKIGLVLLVVLFAFSLGLALPAQPAQAFVFGNVKLTASDGEIGDEFGYSVAISGDTMVVGDPLLTSPGWTAEINQAGSCFGYSLGTAGDVNGDGYDDVIVGAYRYDGDWPDEGAVFVYYGSATGLSTIHDWTATDTWQNEALFGYSVGIAGDVNGDGYDDIIVGEPGYIVAGDVVGRALIYYGSPTGLDTTADLVDYGSQDGALYGGSVGTAGDVNGDGYDDVIVGAYTYDNPDLHAGRAYVYHGSASGVTSVKWQADGDQENAEFGYSVGTAGDVNGDGYDDLIIGARGLSKVFIYLGSATGLNAFPNWAYQGPYSFGYSVGTAGDVNGDGYDDVIIGAEEYDNGENNEGAAFVYYGSAIGLSTSPNWNGEVNQISAHFGNSVGTAGDVNGDSYDDVIVGARLYDNGENNEGAAFIFYGSAIGLSTTSNWEGESNQADSHFGNSVGTAGDVDNDGYDDVIVSTFLWDDLGTGEGAAFVYHGSAEPALSINDVSVVERDSGTSTGVLFWVTLSTPSSGTVTVDYAIADGTATAGADYWASTGTSGTLTFAPGWTAMTIQVDVLGDWLDEADETFFVNLSGSTNAWIVDSKGVCTINDDDPPPKLSINTVVMVEGDSGTTNYEYRVSLERLSGQTVSVEYATANGNATAGTDYEATSGTLTFAPGDTIKTFAVPVFGDTLIEPDEIFWVNLSNPTNATFLDSQGGGRINDDDGPPALRINSVTVVEGNSGTTDAVFTVTLSRTWDMTVTVNYVTADGTATAGTDYQATSGTLTFAPGETTKAIAVPVLGDTLDEFGDTPYQAFETFTVNLSNPTNATIADGQGIGTINDDEPPALSINDRTVVEGDGGTTYAVFTVSPTKIWDMTVTVGYATADGTATARTDYQATSGTLTFAPGETFKNIAVPVLGDTLVEPDETFYVNLSNPTNAIIADGQGIGTINDDEPPALSINDVTVVEGNSEGSNTEFIFTLSNPSGQTVKVDYATADGTATAGTDYQATEGTMTFAPGETLSSITVFTIPDTLEEPDVTFFVNLSNPTNATIADSQGLGTIVDDDPLPALSINDMTVVEGNSGTSDAEFIVTLSNPFGLTVTVGYLTADGTANALTDYQVKFGVLTFTPGETNKTITVRVLSDTLEEPDETFFVNLLNPTNADIADSQGVGTITDDDQEGPPPELPALSINDVMVVEGDSGTTNAVFTVTLSDPFDMTATVDYVTVDRTASAGTDYQATEGTLTFAPGKTIKTIIVPVIGDVLDEHDEIFYVNLSNPTSATIADSQGVGTITDDDLQPGNPPVADDQSVTTNEDTAINITLTADDADGDTLIYSIVDSPVHGSLSSTPPDVTYTPASGYTGSDNFTFKANDGTVDSNIATVTITVNPVGNLPVNFPDANLEAVIREAIDKTTGDIYPADLLPLTTLDGHGKGIIDLTGLEYCVNLTRLDLYNNQIIDLFPLQNLTSLTMLLLMDNQIIDISPLQGLASLNRLDINTNQISDISPLQSLTSLTYLGLNLNQISNISPIQGLISLTTLYLGGNQIIDISPLQSLTSLINLDLHNNQISDISPLQNLTSLTSLILVSNQISDISPLQNLTSLTTLYLGSNQISNISPLQNLTSLTNLYLHANQISDIQPLVDNAGLASDDSVDLTMNPLSDFSINNLIPLLEARGVTVSYTLPDSDQYTLTVDIVGNGSVTKNPDQPTYIYGNSVQLTAIPDTGWSFAAWSGDLVSTANPGTITMDGNKTVTATFTIAGGGNQKLLASDGAAGDWFGRPVAISGDTIVVGAHGDDDNGSESGSAYVFVRSGGVWSQQAKLTASDGSAGDCFGFSVAISGDTAVIGVYHSGYGVTEPGSAYVFVRSGGVWSEQQKLMPSDAASSDYFGSSVAISGETVVVGAWGGDDNGSKSGSAYVFVRSDGIWSQQAKLIASDGAAGDWFGHSVAISGETVVVGAHYDTEGGILYSGSAYVFVRSGATWSQQQKLMASDAAANDLFGWSVAISGDTIVVGAYLDDYEQFNAAGSAYVFVRSGGVWSQQQKLMAGDAADGNTFGYSVAISGDAAVIHSWGDDDWGDGSGSVHVFVRSGTTWSQQQKLIAWDGANFDQFGYSAVAISGDTIVAGAIGDEDVDEDINYNSGSAYVMTRPSGPLQAADDFITVNMNSVCQIDPPGVLFNDTDADEAPLIAIKLTDPAHGSLTLNSDGSLIYTPQANWTGKDRFTYKANNGTADSNVATVYITIKLDNDPPMANNDTYSTNEDTPLFVAMPGVLFNDTDADQDPFIAIKLTDPAHGSLTFNSDGSLIYTPNANYNGTDSFVYTAYDGLETSNIAIVTITINPVNDAPVANSQSVSTNEDTPVNIILTATDVDGDTLIYSIVTPPGHGSLSGTAPDLTYTPAPNYYGPDSFTFEANDLKIDSNIATVTITVTLPDIDGDGIGDIVDIDPNNPSVAFSDGTTSGSVVSLGPGISLWITDAPLPADGVEVLVSGPESGNATLTVNIAGGSTLHLPPGEYTFTGSDVDDGLRAVVLQIPSIREVELQRPDSRATYAMLIVGSYRTWRGSVILEVGDGGLAEVEYTIEGSPIVVVVESDETVSFDESIVNDELQGVNISALQGDVTVNDVVVPEGESLTISANQPPAADDQLVNTGEDTPVNITLTATDTDDDPLTYNIVDSPSHGSLIGTPPNVIYTPELNYSGTDNFTFVANDGQADSNVATVTITVNPVNDPPVLGPITAPVDPVQVNIAINASASFTDPDVGDTHIAVWDWGDGSTSEGIINETGGSGTIDGSHTYATAGVYTIKATVTDDNGGEGESIFQFVVAYNPEGGFVTGGGWINSPAGAYAAKPTLTGKATFGFVSKYQKGATTPTGNTEFQFKAGDLNFHSSSYDWLVIAGHKAKYKGVGTINGSGNYGFMLASIDEALTPSTDVDMFRIKIWDKDNGDTIVYDNQMGDADDDDPTTAIGGGSIVIHNNK